MVFRRIGSIAAEVIQRLETEGKALGTRSPISGVSPTEIGGDRPNAGTNDRSPCAGDVEGERPAQTELEKGPDPKARPSSIGRIGVENIGPKPGRLALIHQSHMAPILTVVRDMGRASPTRLPRAARFMSLVTIDGEAAHADSFAGAGN